MFNKITAIIKGIGLPEYGKKSKLWESEHEKLKLEISKVISDYNSGNMKKVKKDLIKFRTDLFEHILDEELAFMSMTKENILVDEVEEELTKFRDSFSDIKKALNVFFKDYIHNNKPFDEEFKSRLEGIAEVLVKRIYFEEHNLYGLLVTKNSVTKKL